MKIEKPYSRKRTRTITVDADPDKVFALMCPVREYEWEPGWTTNLILSESGLVEEGCVFTTPAGASIGSNVKSREAIWVTPIHDRNTRRLMMIKVTPDECVTRLDIAVDETPAGSSVTTSYQHTALTEAGRTVVDQHTEVRFDEMMAGWRAAIEKTIGAAA
ncbi:MAG: hypothetical protein AAFX54_05425 [Pseudomonadota bacterium]